MFDLAPRSLARLVVRFLYGTFHLETRQRPSNTTLSDYYTTALLANNTAANQLTFLTIFVNTAFAGNYTQPNVGITVPGVLTSGTYNGTAVELLPYFNGDILSTNTGGSNGESVNYLDDGGASALIDNKPATDNTSIQYTLLTNFYGYFGVLLGCTLQGDASFPAYAGSVSMYEVHKFMVLSPAEVGYFIEQVGLAASSFGVASSDIQALGDTLSSLFSDKCTPATTVVTGQLQSICTDPTCPQLSDSNCTGYSDIAKPVSPGSSSTASSSSSLTSTPSNPSPTHSSSPSPTPTPAKSNGLAIGLGLGIPLFVIIIAGIGGAIWFTRRRRRNRAAAVNGPSQPFEKAELDAGVPTGKTMNGGSAVMQPKSELDAPGAVSKPTMTQAVTQAQIPELGAAEAAPQSSITNVAELDAFGGRYELDGREAGH